MNYSITTSDQAEFKLHYLGPQLASMIQDYEEWLKAQDGNGSLAVGDIREKFIEIKRKALLEFFN